MISDFALVSKQARVGECGNALATTFVWTVASADA